MEDFFDLFGKAFVYRVFDELTQDQVWKVFKRSKGEQWSVSNLGLVKRESVKFPKYDGVSFAIYTPEVSVFKGRLSFFLNGQRMYIDTLVAKAFVYNPNHYYKVRHKNGNYLDNRASNLAYIVPNRAKYKPNIDSKCFPLGRVKKAILCYDSDDNLLAEFPSVTIASEVLGVPRCSISKVLHGEYDKVKHKRLGDLIFVVKDGVL